MDDDQLEALRRSGDVIAGYVLGDVLGVGGMGVVYAATQCSTDRPVAVKLPRPELASDPAMCRRLRDEAHTTSTVNHRNVVRALDLGDHDGVPYLVMERVSGVGLGQLVLEHGRMSIANAMNLVGQILSGLEHIHDHGVVHADVKCDNILVETLHDGTAVARIIDFGIAQFVGEPGKRDDDRIISGTPEYLAPELIRGERPTFASDVYAVGVILYELIAGATPFAGGTSVEIMNRQLHHDPALLSWRCPEGDVSAALDALVSRALAKCPATRFATAADFGAALAQLAAIETSAPVMPRMSSNVFSTEATTATMAGDATPPLARGSRGGAMLAELRLADAVTAGNADAIIVAHLELARARVDARQVGTAIAELEHGIELLSGPTDGTPESPVWRLMLTLAALYESSGNRARAKSTTRAAHDQAVRNGSAIGRERAEQLFTRLVRRPSRTPNARA